jgi:LPS export ABC transporter permease LptG/LPS export ABC transporter permease LptF
MAWLRTLDRYVIREILPPFALSLIIFTFILEIPPVMRQLEQLVAKGVSWSAAGKILLTLIPQGLGLTIPMATLTGILVGLGRLSADREAVALLACGVSPYRLLRPVLGFATLMTAATFYVMLQAIPDANQAFREITFELVSKKVASDIRPRVFFDEFPGFVLYTRDEGPGGTWKDVMVADNRKPESSSVYMAAGGQLVVDRPQQRVSLVLTNGVQYTSGRDGETGTYAFPQDIQVTLDPNTVFRREELPRTVTEKSIAELRTDGERKLKAGLSPHPEIMFTQQKFSIPIACLVFAVIGLALGLTSSRDTKMAGFVVGLAVVFAYYGILEIAAAQTRGHYRSIEEARQLASASWVNAYLTRWWPNIIMGVFGVAALVWRARFAQRGLPVSFPVRVPQLPAGWQRRPAPVEAPAAPAPAARRGQRVVVVVRIPRLRIPGGMGVLDRYISRTYLRIMALAFVGLLGLFYISAFVDRAEKVFKNQASVGQVVQFLLYSTPQFVYFVIPIAALLSVLVTFGMLSRTSELTVMKACGISLYRTALPVVALSLIGSAILFGLEQRVLAESNRKADAIDDAIRGRPPRIISPLQRQWLVGREGSIYHYSLFDPQQRVLTGLSVYRPAPTAWTLASQTFAATAEYRNGWMASKGWHRDYTRTPPAFQAFDRRPLALEPPDYFGTEAPIAQFMTVPELQAHIADLKASGFNWLPLAVELQRKIAFPFVTVVMTLLAVPFGVTTGRRGALYGIGIGIVIALAYWVATSVFVAIGSAGMLPPFLAAWSANIIVAGAAIFLFLNTRT